MASQFRLRKKRPGLVFPIFVVGPILLFSYIQSLLPHEPGTKEEKEAVQLAQQALCDEYTGYSDDELLEYLIDKGYSKVEAKTAVASCGADWKEQALKEAYGYIDMEGISYSELVKQLIYLGYSEEEAAYAAQNSNADWNEQACMAAKCWKEYYNNDIEKVHSMLLNIGFSESQVSYGLANCD